MLRLLFALAILATGCSSAADGAAEDPPTSEPVASRTPSSLAALPATTTTATPPTTEQESTTTSEPASPPLRTGAEVLADSGFESLRGSRVGAIVNQTSLVDDQRLIDLLANEPEVELVRLFAPEHGLDGSLAAGVYLTDSTDLSTGVPIVSLYGTSRQPTEAMFADLDVVLFDLQDVGSRSYTYISTMGLAMQTATATGTEFVVLDRPNPVGGETIGGYVLEPGFESFIGQYPMPNRHGLTVGEVALLIDGQAWLPGLEGLRLRVIPVEGWRRSQVWQESGRDWVAPSPRLPTADSALLYNGMVLLAGTSISDGSGTATPFSLAGAPWPESSDELLTSLQASELAGVRFEPVEFTPEAIEGVSPDPLHRGRTLNGVRLVVTDPRTIDPIAVAVEVLVTYQRLAPAGTSIIVDPASFDLVAGSSDLRRRVERGDSAAEIRQSLAPALSEFETLRASVLLYD